MKSKEIERLLTGIRDGISRARQYLLNSADILLDPDYIYMDIDTRQVQLCYVPYSDQKEHTLLKLAEFVLKRLDHGDRQAVELGYAFFHQASRENVGFSELEQALLREKGGRSCDETEENRANAGRYGAIDQYPGTYPDLDSYPGKGMEAYAGRAAGVDEKKTADEEAGWIWEGEGERKGKDRAKAGKKESGKGKKRKETGKKESGRRETGKKGSGRRESGRKKNGSGKGRGKKPQNRKGWIVGSLAAAAALLVFGTVVYVGKLDLTQTGGLAFLLLAVVWIAYETVTGKRESSKKNWIEDDFEEEEEALFPDETFETTGDGEETARGKENGDYRRAEGREPWEESLDGETRCLTDTERGKSVCLLSMEADQYGDLAVKQEKVLLGKKKDQVDIWIRDASVSRIHARLEWAGGECFVTDLNSRNGTYVGGERLMPNEKRELHDGDQISFAARHYRIKIREF